MSIIMSEPLLAERLKRVTVTWQYPMLFSHKRYDERVMDIGLYYISRKLGIWEYSLYIGQTADCFLNRLDSHDFHWLHRYRGRKYVRLGTITYPANKSFEEKKALIKDVEAALIYEMRDILYQNTMCMKSYEPKHLYVIKNEGYRGALSPVVSMREHAYV